MNKRSSYCKRLIIGMLIMALCLGMTPISTFAAEKNQSQKEPSFIEKAGEWLKDTLGLNEEDEGKERATYLDAAYINIREVGTYIDAKAITTPIPAMELNKDYLVKPDKEVNHSMVWYSFTPTETKYYTFAGKDKDKYDFIDSYAKLMLLTQDKDQYVTIEKNDDGRDASYRHFGLNYKLEAGTTYYLWAGYYQKSYNSSYYVNVTEASMVNKVQLVDSNPTCYASLKDDLRIKVGFTDGNVEFSTLGDFYDRYYKLALEFDDEEQEENWDNGVAGTYNPRLVIYHKSAYVDMEDRTIFAASTATITLKDSLEITKIEAEKSVYNLVMGESKDDFVKAVLTYSDGTTATVPLESWDENGNYISLCEDEESETPNSYYFYVGETGADKHPVESERFIINQESPLPLNVDFYYQGHPVEDNLNVSVPRIGSEESDAYVQLSLYKDLSVKLTYADGEQEEYTYDADGNFEDKNGTNCSVYINLDCDIDGLLWASFNLDAWNGDYYQCYQKEITYSIEHASLTIVAKDDNSITNRANIRSDAVSSVLDALEFKAQFTSGDDTREVIFRNGDSIVNPFTENDEYPQIFYPMFNFGEYDYDISMIGDHEYTVSVEDGYMGTVASCTYYYSVVHNENAISITDMTTNITGTLELGENYQIRLTDSEGQKYQFAKPAGYNEEYLVGDYRLCQSVPADQQDDFGAYKPGYYDVTLSLVQIDSDWNYIPVAEIDSITYELYIPGERALKDISVEWNNEYGYLEGKATFSDGVGEDITQELFFNLCDWDEDTEENHYVCSGTNSIYNVPGYGGFKYDFEIAGDLINEEGYLNSGTFDMKVTCGKAEITWDDENWENLAEFIEEPQVYNTSFTIPDENHGEDDECYISFDKGGFDDGIQVGDRFKIPMGDTYVPADKSITWTSSDPSIATVDENGVLTALKPGIVTITAAVGNLASDSCEVTIFEKPEEHVHNMTKVDRVEPSCTTAGSKAYYKCSTCDKVFSDEAGNIETSLKAVILPASHKNISFVEEEAATCIKNGVFSHYKCNDCGKIFFDEDATDPATTSELTIAKSGHEYGEWSETETTRSRICNVCGTKQTEQKEDLSGDNAAQDIRDLVNQAKEDANPGATAPAEVNVSIDTTKDADSKVTVSDDVLKAASDANKDNVTVNVVIDHTKASQEEDRYAWEIDGSTIKEGAKAVNLEVTRTNINSELSNIVEDEAEVIVKVQESSSEATELEPVCQLSIAHDGEFGFTAKLRVYVDKAKAGSYAYLYWYKGAGSAEKVAESKIDSEGYAEFEDMSHASDYFVMTSANQVNVADSVSCSHASKTLVEAVAATCVTDGHKAYYECAKCKHLFDATDNTKEVKADDVVVKAAGHKIAFVRAKAATTAANGNVAYYKCNTCNSLFKDKYGKQATTAKAVTLARLLSAKNGTVMKVGGITYKVTSPYVVSCEKVTVAKKVVVPATIKVKNVPYKVTSLATAALPSNKKIQTVVLGANLTVINNSAFAKCKKLKTITIQSTGMTKATLKAKAFKGVTSKTKIQVPKKVKKAYTTLFRSKGLNKKVKVK